MDYSGDVSDLAHQRDLVVKHDEDLQDDPEVRPDGVIGAGDGDFDRKSEAGHFLYYHV